MAGNNQIFVQVTAFRDPEYQPTLTSLYNKATHPENIRVGAVLQYDSQADDHCFELGLPPGLNVEEDWYEARLSGGMCWARELTQKMYADGGEQFTLQIDSHMRFVPGWDIKLIEMWKRLDDSKAIISHYAPNYEPGQGRVRDQISGIAPYTWKLGTLWMTHAPFYPINNLPPKPTTGAIISGHFMFGPTSIIRDVPYDRRIERHGEETSISVRLWTNGYNIHHPNEPIMWHRAQQKRPMDRDVIPEYSEKVRIGALRARVLLSNLQCDEQEVIADLDKFGLGNVRTLKQYQDWSGINFQEESFTEKAGKGLFDPFNPADYL